MTAVAAPATVSLSDIQAAQQRIAGSVARTPCMPSRALSELCGCEIYAKLEYLQATGSFKERGAANALMKLAEPQRKLGVTAASAGNHALALAMHGQRLGIPVTVVMPKFAPLIKQTRCKKLGATVILHGDTIADAKDHAETLVRAEGLTYIHGFDGLDVIAGQGTIGLELIEDIPDLDAIVSPIGGAGLIAGIAVAVKTLKPNIRIIGVEPEHCASYVAALRADRSVRIESKPTLADGLNVPAVGPNAFALAKERVDEAVTVSEEDIALAILRLIEMEKGVVEGAGATPLAGFISGKLDSLRGKKVALVLAGGNIDPAVLGRVIEYGLVVDHRISRFTAYISDRPGGLAELAAAIASVGASVKQIEHERAFSSADVSRVLVFCTVETRDLAHSDELHACLRQRGIQVIDRR